MLAAAAKRRPTKNIGPLTVIACCTNKNVPPQTMVISTSTHSALLSRENREDGWEVFDDVMTLRTT